MKFVVLVAKFMKFDGVLEKGGIETYICQLIGTLKEFGEIVIVQKADKNFCSKIRDCKVIGYSLDTFQKIYDQVVHPMLENRDIFICSSEQLGVRARWSRSIVIQHGIYWDMNTTFYTSSRAALYLPAFYKLFDNFRNFRKLSSYGTVVCVDYMYLSLYRSICSNSSKIKFWVIPNHASNEFFCDGEGEEPDVVTVIFARRLMRFRGTSEFCNAVLALRSEVPDARYIICGSGPEEDEMKRMLPPGEDVHYMVASIEEMPAIVRMGSIVVVPSLGSEGTSLSAIEGLASGKPVVATSVGGLTNVIVDGFNGFLVEPGNVGELVQSIKKLMLDAELRQRMGSNARSVARASFTSSNWSSKWRQVIDQLGASS